MGKVKVSQKMVNFQGQGHKIKNYGTMQKVLSQEIVIYTCAIWKPYHFW